MTATPAASARPKPRPRPLLRHGPPAAPELLSRGGDELPLAGGESRAGAPGVQLLGRAWPPSFRFPPASSSGRRSVLKAVEVRLAVRGSGRGSLLAEDRQRDEEDRRPSLTRATFRPHLPPAPRPPAPAPTPSRPRCRDRIGRKGFEAKSTPRTRSGIERAVVAAPDVDVVLDDRLGRDAERGLPATRGSPRGSRRTGRGSARGS